MELKNRNKMDQNNRNKETLTLKDYAYVCLGIIFLSLTIVGITNQTWFGRFLTYCFSYVFGFFYPFAFAFLVLIFLRLILKRSFFPLKGNGMTLIGIILIAIACLGFGSFSFIVENSNLAFTDVLGIYNNRMIAFAPTAFYPDNFSSLGGLGGGFIGLFLVGLFGSVLKAVGDAILFSIILILGILLLVYRPVKKIVDDLKIKRDKKVQYEPSRAKKIVDRDDPKAVTSPIEELKRQNLVGSLFPKKTEAQPSYYEEPKETFQPNYQQAGFSSSMNNQDLFASRMTQNTPAIESKPMLKEAQEEPEEEQFEIEDKWSHPQGGFRSSSGYYKKTETATIEPSKPVIEAQPAKPSYQPIEENPIKENYHLSDEMNKLATERAQAFRESATSPNHNDYEVLQPEPNFNPLEEQAKHVASIPVKPVVQPNEFVVDDPQKEIEMEPETPKAPEKTKEELEEEEEARLTQNYFIEKAQKQIEKQKSAEEARQRELASVMRYVSAKPRAYSYKFPDDSILEEHDDSDKQQINNDSAQEKAKVINKVFSDFGFPAKAVSYTIGSSVTRFNIQTEPGVRSDKIESYLSELQIALNGDQSVRIQTVVEGRTTSGVEVGNAAPMAVSFKSVFQEIEKNTKDNLLLPIGKDVGGNIVTFPLDKMPHLLVAGTTGSGKSVLVNCMIMTLIMRNYPSQLKLMLIDPKQVEFAKYDMEPHLYCPVIQDAESAISALGKLCVEMDRRYSVLKQYGVVKLSEYRAKRVGHENDMEEIPDVVCVIDEFADLMNTGGDEIAGYVQRLTQKSRAAGIYLIIATQRPSKDAIPMIIKANIVCRIGLACSSQIDSRVILDENGCEALIGRGDLLFKCPTKKNLTRCQSPFISDEETDRILDYLKKSAGDPNYDSDFVDLKPRNENEEESVPSQEDVYEEVKDFVMKTGICTKSSIMQNFSQTSAKTDQILMKLRSEGIIMPAVGGKNIVLKRRNSGE